MSAPMLFRWDAVNCCMVPLARFIGRAGKEFLDKENYLLEPLHERSRESHDHFFACVHLAWENLPEAYKGRWRDEEHMRRDVLIDVAFCDETYISCASKVEAMRMAIAQPSILRAMDRHCRATAVGKSVFIQIAHSQSMQGMKTKKRFEASKTAVLTYLSKIIGTQLETLLAEGQAAVAPRVA